MVSIVSQHFVCWRRNTLTAKQLFLWWLLMQTNQLCCRQSSLIRDMPIGWLRTTWERIWRKVFMGMSSFVTFWRLTLNSKSKLQSSLSRVSTLRKSSKKELWKSLMKSTWKLPKRLLLCALSQWNSTPRSFSVGMSWWHSTVYGIKSLISRRMSNDWVSSKCRSLNLVKNGRERTRTYCGKISISQ